MTDANGKNGNGGILKEVFETRERAAAWVTRLLILAISGLATVTLWLASQQLTDIKQTISGTVRNLHDDISAITKNQNQNTLNITQLTATVNDQISRQTDADTTMRGELQDHETRIRTLESKEPSGH